MNNPSKAPSSVSGRRKRLLSIAAAAAVMVSTLGFATPAQAATKDATSDAPWMVQGKAVAYLAPGTIGLCNAGWGDVSVQRYDNAKYLGKIDLFCGDSGQGYVHIRARHQRQWQDRINQVGQGGNWDDLMVWVVGQAVTSPASGYPKDIGGGKSCYSTLIYMKGTKGTVSFRPSIVVSRNNKRVITAIPTTVPTTSCS